MVGHKAVGPDLHLFFSAPLFEEMKIMIVVIIQKKTWLRLCPFEWRDVGIRVIQLLLVWPWDDIGALIKGYVLLNYFGRK